MQNPLLSLHSILTALDLDTACIPLLEQVHGHAEMMHASTPETVYAAIRNIGDTLNASEKAGQLAEELEERINIISHKLKFITEENKPNVQFLDDVLPVRTFYNEYLGNMVRIAGGIVHHEAPNPHIVIVITNKPVPNLLSELPNLISASEWSNTEGVRNGNVYVIRHGDYLRYPGATIADDAEILAEILHPNHFIFGRDKDAWMKFEWQ